MFAEALRETTETLRDAGIDNPAREARLLINHALGELPNALQSPATEIDAAVLAPLVARRAAREPMAFITGTQGFWSLALECTPATLIPRPDSESLVEAALAAFPMGGVNTVLDLGTGTGCLLLAVLQEFPAAWGLGIDRSAAAAALAARNARHTGLTGRACMLCGHWADAVTGRFDLILANPPYIESDTIIDLMPEVANHEPRTALDGGPDGLAAYRALLPEFPRLLAPGGVAILEIGAGQDAAVAALARATGANSVALRPDLGGIARAAMLRWT